MRRERDNVTRDRGNECSKANGLWMDNEALFNWGPHGIPN